MKINFENKKLIISFSASTFVDQLIAGAFATAAVVEFFWYAPEQMGW